MFNYNEEIRVFKLEKMALGIADGISCILGFAQYYNNHGCLTTESIDDVYNKFDHDPFALLQMTESEDDELNDMLYELRILLRSVPEYNSARICQLFRNFPDHMNKATDTSCEVYKHLKMLVSTHYNSIFN